MVYMEELFGSGRIDVSSMKTGLTNFGPITLQTNEEWVDVFSAIETEINFFPLAYHFNILT